MDFESSLWWASTACVQKRCLFVPRPLQYGILSHSKSWWFWTLWILCLWVPNSWTCFGVCPDCQQSTSRQTHSSHLAGLDEPFHFLAPVPIWILDDFGHVQCLSFEALASVAFGPRSRNRSMRSVFHHALREGDLAKLPRSCIGGGSAGCVLSLPLFVGGQMWYP